MTDELKKEILDLIKGHLVINITKDGDYYGNYTYNVSLSLLDENWVAQKFSYSYD